ncbi:MAG TPA: hypothetical protein PKA27_04545 [Fimbriimonadaceae bacterium]|nr:hypothetical protein [Fimbriimonadaceae bacterium]
MKNILVCAIALCAALAAADSVDDIQSGADVSYDLRSLNYAYSGAQSGSGSIGDAEAPPACIPKSAGTLNFTLNSSTFGFPFSVNMTFTGTKVSATRVRWDTNTLVNQCITIDLNGVPTNVLIYRIVGRLTANAATIPPFFDSVCGRGYNVGLDDTASNTDSYFNVEAYGLCIRTTLTRIDFQMRDMDFIGFAGLPKGQVRPLTYSVVEGEEFEGGLTNLYESDDARVSAFSSPETLGTIVEFSTDLPQANLSRLDFTQESKVDRPGLGRSVSLFNVVSTSWNVVSGGTASLTDVTTTASITSDTGRYIDSATRQTRARLAWAPINDEDPSQDGWLHAIDFVIWSVE